VEAGSYGQDRAKRVLVIAPDPEELLNLAPWYLTTSLSVWEIRTIMKGSS
jgi:hypothetical protein